jgi:hypothetical protein
MLVAKWILFLLIGKIVIHVWMKFELPKPIKKYQWFVKLHDCGLCSGVWVFTLLSLFMGVDLLSIVLYEYVPLVSEIITGIVVSWTVWIFTLGWHSAYDVLVV